ncbi:TIGR04282 family arsenosugar biosynthesis glycosyltransferase [Micromonospora schwarzwaldensis]|uniref:TIGR04282 family arsenosugar biosynthesis glycosyltransferase n=1 Tax=Micromonospora sp. DSM 45708 TaxID=3111767 RepID=UPI0031CE3D66
MTVLLVVAKAPVPGAVKTRLCPPATPAQAARIAAAALRDTLDAVAATGGVTPVLALAGCLADAEDGVELAATVAGWPVLPQRGDGFADRLAHAHADVAHAYPGRPVLQIGMDTPQVTPALLADGVRRLSAPGVEAVLGPAADGGWWALGLRDPRRAAALRAVPMSTADTGRLTYAALLGAGLRVGALPALRDVDDWADARAVAQTIPGSRFAREVAALRPTLTAGGSR